MTEEAIEINLKKIINLISISKIPLLLIITTFLLFGYLFDRNSKNEWSGEIEISKINFAEQSKYLNFLIGSENLKDFAIANEISTSHINLNTDTFQHTLYLLFTDELKDREEIVMALKSLNFIPRGQMSDEEYNEILRETAFNVIIQDIEIDPDIDDLSFTISFSSNSRSMIKNIFSYVLDNVNLNVSKYLQFNIREQKNITNNLIKNKLTAIESAKRNEIINHMEEMEKSMTFLQEQAQIARSLNLESNQLTQSIILDEFKTSENDFTPPYYLRGFVAIEKEIELINKRTNDNILSEEILELNKSLRKLSSFQNLLDTFDLYKGTPINSGEFKAALYDPNSIKYSNSKPSLLKTLIISFAISMLVSFTFITYRWLFREDAL